MLFHPLSERNVVRNISRFLSLDTGCRGHPCRRRCGTHRGFHVNRSAVRSPSPRATNLRRQRAITLALLPTSARIPAPTIHDSGSPTCRTLRGITLRKTFSGKCFLTSSEISWLSRFRESNIVSTRPSSSSAGPQRRLDLVDRAEEGAQTFERVVLALHRHQHRICGDERVQGENPERRWRIN